MVISVSEAVRYTAAALKSISDEADREARLIVAHLSGCEPNRLIISSAAVDTEDIDPIVEKRRQGVPLQYIFGRWWFYDNEFLVGEGVLIPRQDTELLVETGLELIKGLKFPRVIDLCSGSGCIGISIACERPDARVVALEKYDAAFGYLQKNIEHIGAENVKAVKADVLEKPFGEYDLIVCNPPYIPNGDKGELSPEVLNEPHTALFGGEDGLFFYREITRLWKSALKNGGRLAFEVGIKEADLVARILESEGFTQISFKTDLIGIQRVVFGTVNSL
ncbi:MAG: peptide chain release factor N(5)-glutamine methyltransferase [Clostridia bacterium]|nr:peptide chain release factor N(5)-glutamine methyltransferase [Clostridia bacterium]